MRRAITFKLNQVFNTRSRNDTFACRPAETPNTVSEINSNYGPIESGTTPYVYGALIESFRQHGMDPSFSKIYRVANGIKEYERLVGKKPFSDFEQMPETQNKGIKEFIKALDNTVSLFGDSYLIPSTVFCLLTEVESKLRS
jgi:hypothetical protein